MNKLMKDEANDVGLSKTTSLKRILPTTFTTSTSTTTNNNNNNSSHSPREAKEDSSNNENSPVLSSKKTKRWSLHVEAIIHPCCPISFDELGVKIEDFVKNVGQSSFMYREGNMDLSKASLLIQNSCLQIKIVDIPTPTVTPTSTSQGTQKEDSNNHPSKNKSTKQTTIIQQPNSAIPSWSISNIIIHTYTLSTIPPEPEEIENENNEEPITVCDVLTLPHESLHTSWENLIYPSHIKDNIIGYAESSLLFSNKGVSNHIISWNRVLLLHGPPGTGKTSLCRALAQKLTIRTNHIFPSGGYLLEIKSHSLFSKWFSESGKLISKLFERIRELVEDEPNSLFCVLIDEVESLAASRVSGGGSSGGGGGGAAEPSDAVRAVNSVLTSLDSIRSYRNVLVLTTTNITNSIDAAFVDRVDLKQYVGYPCLEARYEILRSCILELIRVGIVSYTLDELKSFHFALELDSKDGGTVDDNHDHDKVDNDTHDDINQNDTNQNNNNVCHESLLLRCAEAAENLSGRSLRKLPFQSHAFFVRSADIVPLQQFLVSLKNGIEKEKCSRNDLDKEE